MFSKHLKQTKWYDRVGYNKTTVLLITMATCLAGKYRLNSTQQAFKPANKISLDYIFLLRSWPNDYGKMCNCRSITLRFAFSKNKEAFSDDRTHFKTLLGHWNGKKRLKHELLNKNVSITCISGHVWEVWAGFIFNNTTWRLDILFLCRLYRAYTCILCDLHITAIEFVVRAVNHFPFVRKQCMAWL